MNKNLGLGKGCDVKGGKWQVFACSGNSDFYCIECVGSKVAEVVRPFF